MTIPVITFEVPRLLFPNVFRERSDVRMPGPRYSVTFDHEAVPQDLIAQYGIVGRWWRAGECYTTTARSEHPVTVVYEGHRPNPHTTLQCARDSNLSPDKLLEGIPAELALKVVELDRPHYRGNVLALYAIKVSADDLATRYDELCAKYFTGG